MKSKIIKLTARLMTAVMTMTAVSALSPSDVMASTSISVGKGSGCDFSTIQAAVESIDRIPTEQNPVNIYVNKGVYEEAVSIDKPYVNIIGKGKASDVVISYDKANGHSDKAKNVGTEKSATFTVAQQAKGFSAQNVTFENSYNISDTSRKQTQAVAFASLADKVILKECNFIGRQDTLYLKGASKGQSVYGSCNNARVYLSNCYIEGTVDFIFGDATAYFDKCKLFMAYYENGGHFTAPNTTLFNLGYVFNGCELSVDKKYTTANKSKIDLGRPWQCDADYPNYGSQSVYISCKLPDILSDKGFSLWDKSTVANKVRFMEYDSRTSSGSKLGSVKRADFVTELTAAQAEAYNVYNVLGGNDGWNPAAAVRTGKTAADLTLDKYVLNIPLGESDTIKTTVLPAGAADKTELYTDSDIITIEGGKITAQKTGSAKVYVKLPNGLTKYAVVNVISARTAAPEIDKISISAKEIIKPTNRLTANYSFPLASDNNTDTSLIRWYALKNGVMTLLKEGVGDYYKTYTVQNADVGSKIVLGVKPATKTTYGKYGDEVQYTSLSEVVAADDSTKLYLRDGFENGVKRYTASGSWQKIATDGNSFITNSGSEASLSYPGSSTWKDATYELKLRCNPLGTGLDGDNEIDFDINNSGSSCYRLVINRGGNTKSLKLNLYKIVNSEQTLLYKDEDKLKNAVLTNSGNDNPYMYVSLAKNDGDLNLKFRLEGSDTRLINKTVKDSSPLSGGTMQLSLKGKENIWLVDTLTAEETKKVDKESQIRIYLAGDSTVKYYGDDNSIGGWGEYIVNYFDDGVDIINKAEGGRSTRSYLNQGRLDEITSQLREGDYVFIQFGHNDNRTDENAFVEHSVALGTPDENGIYPTIRAQKTKTPQRIIDFYKNDAYPYGEYFYPYESGTFKWYLQQYVDKVKEKGATPVIITPVCRVLFDADGKIQPAFGENNGYKLAVEQVAKENNVTCINAYDITKSLYESYGVMTTHGLHDVKDDGTMDLTHYNKFGANIVASKLADAVAEQIPELKSHLKASTQYVAKTDDMKTANLFVVGDAGNDGVDNDIFASHSFSEYLQGYLSDKVKVQDMTQAGVTAKAFAKTEAYKDFIDSVKEGDYVMICFGKNDGNMLADGYTSAGVGKESKNGFYYNVYNNYVLPVVNKKAVPILITPINDRAFDENGIAVDTTAKYADDIKAIVTDNSLYFVNVSDISYTLYKNMGEEGSKVLNALDKENGIDNSALSEFGAKTITKQIMNNLKFSSATLKNYILDAKLNEKTVYTRGEFVKSMAKIIGIENAGYTTNFRDVLKGKSYEKAVGAAASLGIISGDSAGCFYPEAVLDGDSMTTMLYAAMEYKGLDPYTLNDVFHFGEGAISSEIGLWALDRLCEEVSAK